jgi:hypothetical protein
MPIRYATPVEIVPAQKTVDIRCTRVTMLPDTGEIAYEFQAFDGNNNKVGDLHTSVRYGVDLLPDTKIVTTQRVEVTAGMVYEAIKAHAYSTVTRQLGSGVISDE